MDRQQERTDDQSLLELLGDHKHDHVYSYDCDDRSNPAYYDDHNHAVNDYHNGTWAHYHDLIAERYVYHDDHRRTVVYDYGPARLY